MLNNVDYKRFSILTFSHFYPAKVQLSIYPYISIIYMSKQSYNNVNPDQIVSSEASWSGSTMFSKKDKSGVQQEGLNIFSENT